MVPSTSPSHMLFATMGCTAISCCQSGAVWQGNGSHCFGHWPAWWWLSVPPGPKNHLVQAISNLACSPLAVASPNLCPPDCASWGLNGLHLRPTLNWLTQHMTRLPAIHLWACHYTPTNYFVWTPSDCELGWSFEAEEWDVKYTGDAWPLFLRWWGLISAI